VNIYFWPIVGYLTFLIGFGAYQSKKIKTQDDFAVAGRSLPAFVLFGTLVATWTGTGSIFGFAEKTYQTGVEVWKCFY